MIKLISFIKDYHAYKVGVAKIKYFDLTLSCDVNIRKDNKGIWIRMPQAITRAKVAYNCAHWENKECSETFQKEVLEQLQKTFPDAFNIPDKTERNRWRNSKKKAFKNRKEPIKQPFETTTKPVQESLPIGKARSVSRFAK